MYGTRQAVSAWQDEVGKGGWFVHISPVHIPRSLIRFCCRKGREEDFFFHVVFQGARKPKNEICSFNSTDVFRVSPQFV